MSYIVSQNSVITSIGGGSLSGQKFLTCGGTNIAPKSGEWDNFQVPINQSTVTNFKYIFNIGKFNGSISPAITGFPSSNTSPNIPNTIKQSLYNGGTIQYICGQFSLTNPPVTAQNIMYFNPNVPKTQDAVFQNLSGISFSGANNSVNCMTNNLNGTFTKIYLAGRFDSASISPNTTSYNNIVCLNVTPTPSWTIDTTFSTASTLIDSSSVTINSMIIVNRVLYVAGTDGTNCIFYRFNGTWTDLLNGTFAGNINVLQAIGTTSIAIGGKFTTLKTATNCNNVVLYTISSGICSSLGSGATKGVTGVAAISPIYADPEVFALTYFTSPSYLWVGGYFLDAGGALANSIAVCRINIRTQTGTWITIQRISDTVVGLLKATDPEVLSTDPGVVYTLSSATIDTAAVVVGGSFRTTISTPDPTITYFYNLVKITNTLTTTTVSRCAYSKFNSLSSTTTKN